MKKVIQFGLLLIIALTIFFYRNQIISFVVKNFFFSEGVIINDKNEYTLDYKYLYVQTTDDFYAKSKQHLYNIIYTGLNNGTDEFYFFCDYDKCRDDVNDMSTNNAFLDINNFIHPYNSYYKLYISITAYDKVTISMDKTYDSASIMKINQEIDDIEKKNITDKMSNRDKIKAFHDYIINLTDYDTEYVINHLDEPKNPSHNATGPLFYHKALCGGYTDVMAIFLNRLGIPNYRISSTDHIWNLVQLEDQWLHLDLTWDDPVVADNSKMLIDKFFLINTSQLESFNTKYHIFNKDIYLEASK